MIERVEAALVKAYGTRRAQALRWLVERRMWGGAHAPGLALPHCVFCAGALGTRVFREALCDRCVETALNWWLRKYRKQPLPDEEMALAETRRALGRDTEAEAWLEARLSAPADPGHCSHCGPRWPWPREARADERCFLCGQDRKRTPTIIAGPGRGVCVYCLEDLAREVRRARRPRR